MRLADKIVTPQDVVDFLNKLLEVDRAAMDALFSVRVPCNNAMVGHPTVQISRIMSAGRMGPFTHLVGIMGILNGIFALDDPEVWGCIAMEVDEKHMITGFRLLEGKNTAPE